MGGHYRLLTGIGRDNTRYAVRMSLQVAATASSLIGSDWQLYVIGTGLTSGRPGLRLPKCGAGTRLTYWLWVITRFIAGQE
ncbi:hypothetical protein PoB_000320500 [Plakobranchus ocellatus]|uniref:Uncharacterized protein n=1 Tax=Plakobranchus ocellatus TaxID=259542 RepID=A0AAV3Y0U3_9GAST|nr:hypothetical protein PoB_000320500 [Plakobranchus ocellatus]